MTPMRLRITIDRATLAWLLTPEKLPAEHVSRALYELNGAEARVSDLLGKLRAARRRLAERLAGTGRT